MGGNPLWKSAVAAQGDPSIGKTLVYHFHVIQGNPFFATKAPNPSKACFLGHFVLDLIGRNRIIRFELKAG
jgi:hypothetical protein